MNDDRIDFDEVCRRLNKPPEFVSGIARSGLLGEVVAGLFKSRSIDSFLLYGTQWDEMPDRNLPDGLDSTSIGEVTTPLTHAQARIGSISTLDPKDDIGWISQYYLQPNRAFYASDRSLSLLGSTGILLKRMMHITVGAVDTFLCPNPAGQLALIMTIPKPEAVNDSIAARLLSDSTFRYLLASLAFEHERPLICSHQIEIGLPSGVITYRYFKISHASNLKTSAFKGLSNAKILEIKALASEALSNPDVFYKFLCLWKAFELTQELKKELHGKKLIARKQIDDERIPVGFEFQPHEGQKFTRVFDSYRDTHRNAIAHSILTKKPVRLLSSRQDMDEVWFALPIFFFMVKTRVKKLEDLLLEQA